MATVTYEQTRRNYVDPRNEYPAPEDADFAAHVAVIVALMAYFFTG
jgi:hypothetical protein